MNPYMAYEAVNTKIATRKSRIFDEKKLDKILECNSVEQVTAFLKSKYNLKQIIEEAKCQELHRDDLETILNRFEVNEVEDILHYFSGPYKDFLQTILMKYEISDLIMILRKIVKGDDIYGIENEFIHSDNYSVLPYSKLTASKSVPQFLENLKNTSYYDAIKTVTDSDVIKREFHTEMKLQALFHRTLLRKSMKLGSADRQVVYDIAGMKIDFLNVQWIYRAKKYYDVSPEQMLIYSLQGGKRLGFDRLKKLCYSKSSDEMKQLSNKYLNYNIFMSNKDIDIEKNIDNYIFAYVKGNKFQGTIGTALSYILILDIVVKDLITVTEGIRYKLPKDQLKKYLIRLV